MEVTILVNPLSLTMLLTFHRNDTVIDGAIEMIKHLMQVAACLIGMSATGLLLPLDHAHAEYRLQAGDIIEIAVAGIPELKHRVSVQLDGSITFPLAGTLVAEGLSIAQVRARVQSAIASKEFRVRLSDGRELSRTIERDDIAATIIEYKPIFVSGDVARIGEQAFRPRMLVRQALAAAGGTVTIPTGNSDAATLRSDYITSWLAVYSYLSRQWRIRTELNQEVAFVTNGLPPAPVPERALRQIVELEREYMTARQSDHQRSKDYLRESLRLVSDQITALTREQESEAEGLLSDTKEHKKATDAYGAGNLPSYRVFDLRRAVQTTSSRLLQTTSQLMQARRTHAELTRDLEKIDEQRKIALLSELQEAQHKLNVERAKLQGLEERLHAAGMRAPRAAERTAGLDIVIFRRVNAQAERVAADLDTELNPGDVIEVTLRPEAGDSVWP